MISSNISICPICGGKLKYYDKVSRTIRIKGGKKQRINLRRFRCTNCFRLHREIPDSIYPHKQYDAEIIRGVMEGLITSETLGYEDYPCDVTMSRWLNNKFKMEFAKELYI